MNYLQLVNEMLSEAGLLDGQLTTLAGASGMAAKGKRHVMRAWQRIQQGRPNWRFRWLRPTPVALSIGVANYADTALCPEGLGTLDPDNLFITVDGTVQRLTWCDWEDFALQYGTSMQSGRPGVVTLDPSRQIAFDRIPDQAYPVSLCYWRKLQNLTIDTDTPYLQEDLHPAIVYQALMLYAKHDEAPQVERSFREEYNEWMGNLDRSEKARPRWAGSELSAAGNVDSWPRGW